MQKKVALPETGNLIKGFLMGLANGFLSLIEALLHIIAWCVDNIIGFKLGLDTDRQINGSAYIESRKRIEAMEDMYDFISQNLSNFFDSIRNLWNTFEPAQLIKLFATIKSKIQSKVKGLTRYDIAYFCGSIIFEIIFSIVLALLTGGASAIAQLSTKAERVAQLLKIILQETISTVTFGILDLVKLIKAIFTKIFAIAKSTARAFKNFIEYIIELITKKADEITHEAENLPLPKTYVYCALPISLTPAQQRWLKAARIVFYKDLKIMFLKYGSETFVNKQWLKSKLIKGLTKEDFEELLNIRMLKKEFYNKNVVKLKLEVEITNGKLIEQDFFAIAGDGVNASGSSHNVAKQNYMENWEMNETQVDDLFHDKTKNKARFHDSEHKMLDDVNEFILTLYAKYGKNNVKVVGMNIKTLYEPCIVCKKQILIYKELHKITEVVVEATKRTPKTYVKDNKQLNKIINKTK